MNTQDTFPFKLIIKDYDLLTPLKNKEIQITNIDSKQCYESKITTANGEVIFEIPQNERGDFFSVELINDDDYEINPYYLAKESNKIVSNNPHRLDSNKCKSKNTTNKILTPNNYQKYPASPYFKAKIYLYFNGFTLSVMQGNKEIASYEARSGKALTLQEKAELEQQKGYTHFVPSFTDFDYTNDFDRHSQDNSTTIKKTHQPLFHCYDKGYQDENNTIKDGEYYLSAQEIKDLLEKYESSKSKDSSKSNHSNKTNTIDNSNDLNKPNSNNSKSNDSNNTNSNHANNTDTTQFNIDLSLNIYSDKECSKKYCEAINCKTEMTNKNIYLKDNIAKFIFSKDTQNIKCIVDYKPNLVKSIKIQGHNSSVFANINAPFATGTYIRLEAIQQQNDTTNDAKALSTIYWREELYATKSNVTNFENVPYKSIKTFITGQYIQDFYLSTPKEIDLLRQKGYVDFTYIIYASSINHFDSNTTHLKFNLNFEVGIGNDDEVRESSRGNGNTSSNTTHNIYTLRQAVEFLRATYYEKIVPFYETNKNRYKPDANGETKHNYILDYCKTYPRIAGKIAYIYYRFDLGNEDFISSVEKKNGAYQKDREYFIDKVVGVFENGYYESKILRGKIRFREAYSNPLFDGYSLFSSQLNDKKSKINGVDFYDEREIFVKDLIIQICHLFGLKLLNVDIKPFNFRGAVFYDDKKGILLKIDKDLLINTNKIYDQNPYKTLTYQSGRLIGTIIHECRHLYIREVLTKTKYNNICVQYLIYSLNLDDDSIFYAYQKLCVDKEYSKVNCYIGESQTLYEICPNERDARYVANAAISKLNIK